MLILAECSVHPPLHSEARQEIQAWLGPMVDDGFLHGGYVDEAGQRVWLLLAAETHLDVVGRLGDLPIVRSGQVAFRTSAVTAVRYS